jgi:hypothetical protein
MSGPHWKVGIHCNVKRWGTQFPFVRIFFPAHLNLSNQCVQQPHVENWQWNVIFYWPCISSKILVNKQPDALFHVFIYSFHLCTCFEHQVFIIRRSNCISTSSGMISLCKWLFGMPVRRELIIPDDVLIQFDLLRMSNWCSKHVERWNDKINTWKSSSGWLLTRTDIDLSLPILGLGILCYLISSK